MTETFVKTLTKTAIQTYIEIQNETDKKTQTKRLSNRLKKIDKVANDRQVIYYTNELSQMETDILLLE